MIEAGEITFNGFDLIHPLGGYYYGVSQVDGGQQKLRGENIPITGHDGTLYVEKKKGEAKVTIYMIAKSEESLVFLKQDVFQRGLHNFNCSPSAIKGVDAECTDFRYSFVAGDVIKITVEITVPKLV